MLKEDKKSVFTGCAHRQSREKNDTSYRIRGKTLHRLLEIGYREEGHDETALFARNEENPLIADVIIVDEMSMVDILLMNHLLKAITPGTVLIMVGDANQLPSVGPGNVLRDIISSEKIKKIKLTQNYRQNENSMITLNAHHINNGRMPEMNNRNGDFFLLTKNSTEKLVSTVVDLCTTKVTQIHTVTILWRIYRLLTPLRKGAAGVNEMIIRLQAVLNPKKHGVENTSSGILRTVKAIRSCKSKNNYDLTW